MYQGTNPALLLKVPGKDLTGCKVFVSFKTGTRVTTKTGDDLTVTLENEDTEVLCWLTQEDTLAMSEGEGEVQIRYITDENQARATQKKPITIKSVIYKKVIEYGGGEEE